MQMIVVMKEFGWTYEEYQNTPSFVVTAIQEKMKRDRKREELEAKRTQRGRN